MNYEVVQVAARQIVGNGIRVTNQAADCQQKIGALWENFCTPDKIQVCAMGYIQNTNGRTPVILRLWARRVRYARLMGQSLRFRQERMQDFIFRGTCAQESMRYGRRFGRWNCSAPIQQILRNMCTVMQMDRERSMSMLPLQIIASRVPCR